MSQFKITISGSGGKPDKNKKAAAACVAALKKSGASVVAAAVTYADGAVQVLAGPKAEE